VIAALTVDAVPIGVGIVPVNDPSAAFAAVIVVVVASFTEGIVAVTLRIIPPNSVPTPVTDGCVLLQTAMAEKFTIELVQLLPGYLPQAHAALTFFFH